MQLISRKDIASVDLNEGLKRNRCGTVIATGDHHGNAFAAALYRDGEPVDITDCAVTGYFIRPAGDTVVIAGEVVGINEAEVMLPQACYIDEGIFSLAIKVSGDDFTATVRVVDGMIKLSQTDVLVDPGEVVPALDDLLAHIAEMEAITNKAKTVADISAPPIVLEAIGSAPLNAASGGADDRPFLQFGIMGRTTQDGTPTAAAPVDLVSIPAGDVKANLANMDATNVVDVTVSIADDLRGIPSSINANFTDEDGVSWVCDEIDLARGVLIKRVGVVSGSNMTWYANGGRWQCTVSDPHPMALLDKAYWPIMCNIAANSESGAANTCRAGNQTNAGMLLVYAPQDYDMSGVVVLYQCKPVEIPLSDAEIEAAKALQSRSKIMRFSSVPVTGMHLRYVAETKRYIDNIAAGGSGSGSGGGVSPVVAVNKVGNATTITVTDIEGTKSATIYDGADGAAGADGSPGKDGTSVTVKSVSTSNADGGSNVVTFSDGKTVTIKNGSKGSKGDTGETGPAGADGKTPVKGTDYFTAADKTDMVSQVKTSLGYTTDTWTFTLSDGSVITRKVVLS